MGCPARMRFGIVLGPFHRVGENPPLALDWDLELIRWLDYLGSDEAWIGEHHMEPHITGPMSAMKRSWPDARGLLSARADYAKRLD
jgi:hypothetical protein